ncbi:MAG: ATP-binding protein, partial [Planctomycetota bacterium]
MPYLMDSMMGEQSIAFFSQGPTSSSPTFTIDLGETHALDRIHLHAVDLSDTVPQSYKDGHGMPRRMLIEGANKADFSDAVELLSIQLSPVYDFGPIIMRTFAQQSVRFVRLTARVPDTFLRRQTEFVRIGFAEIELFSQGKNVALSSPVEINFQPSDRKRPLSAITDGRNFYGNILPLRDWINELALRHDLETMRPLVVAELNQRYAQ